MLRSLNSKHYAGAICNVVTYHAIAKRFEKAERYLKILDSLNKELYLRAVYNLVLAYGKDKKTEDIRRLIEKIWCIKHEWVAMALANAISDENDLERVKFYLFRLNELGYPILIAKGLTNAIARFYKLKSSKDLDRFDEIFESLKGKLEEIKKKDILVAYELAEQIGKASLGAVIFYSERGELEKAEKYAGLVEGVFKPKAVDSYVKLHDETVKVWSDRRLFTS